MYPYDEMRGERINILVEEEKLKKANAAKYPWSEVCIKGKRYPLSCPHTTRRNT